MKRSLRLRNPLAICLQEEEDDEYLSNEILSEKMHHSFYILSTPLGEEDDDYISEEILSEIDYDDIPWGEEDDTHFEVDTEREEAWLYLEDLPPIHVSMYNPHQTLEEN